MEKKKFSTDFKTLKQEVELTFYKSSGPGGQRKNKKETAVRLYHPPSGITTVATEHRSQVKNRELAFNRLQKKLKELNKEKKQRKPKKVPCYSRKKRLDEKKKQSKKKKHRKKLVIKEDDMGD